MRAPYKDGHHHVRIGALHLRDGGAELGHVEWEEVLTDNLAAGLGRIVTHPVGRYLSVVVIGGQYVQPRPVVLDGPWDQHLQLLRGDHAGNEGVAVADASLVEDVVEIQQLGLAERRSDCLA